LRLGGGFALGGLLFTLGPRVVGVVLVGRRIRPPGLVRRQVLFIRGGRSASGRQEGGQRQCPVGSFHRGTSNLSRNDETSTPRPAGLERARWGRPARAPQARCRRPIPARRASEGPRARTLAGASGWSEIDAVIPWATPLFGVLVGHLHRLWPS